jgi:hypothetical protein
MARTLTIRLAAEDRAVLEAAAEKRGMGLSAYVRELAERDARRRRYEEVRAQGEAVVEHLASHADARDEVAELGTPQTDLP